MTKEQLDVSLDIIEQNEGFVPYIYKDTKGIDTIGFGRNLRIYPLTDKELREHCYKNAKDELCLNKTYAVDCLKEEIEEINSKLSYYNWYDATKGLLYRRAALIDIVYNMGLDKFLRYKNTIQYLQERNYDKAAEELLKGTGKDGKSKYYEQVGLRALRNSMMIRDNKYYSKEELK